MADLIFFGGVEIFANRDPFLMFLFLKNSWFYIFFLFSFSEMGSSSKDFFKTKMGPMCKDFW